MKKLPFLVALLCACAMGFAAENLAKDKTVFAGAFPGNDYRPALANDGLINTRWASNGAKHYAAVGDAAEDWWYVDLGAIYEIDSVRVWYETAAPTDYDILVSTTSASWTVIGTYAAQPKVGQGAADANVYEFEAGKIGRYVKIFARQGYADLAYGFSMWEFEVYGKPATLDDHNAPELTKAVLSGEPTFNQAQLEVAGTDDEDGTVVVFHVIDVANGIDESCVASEGIITITGLTAETTYNFTVKAVDAAGNESENSIVVENVTTAIDTTIPQAAAPAPEARDAQWYRSLYSDTYTTALKHGFAFQNWGSVAGTEKTIGENHYILYDMTLGTQVIWGENNDSGNAIVAKDEYRGGGTGVDATSMEYLHLDVWSLVAISNIKVLVNDNQLSTINLTGEGWQSFDIELANPVDANINLANVRWFKIVDITDANRQKLAFDNIYFWREPVTSDTDAPTNVTAEFVSAELLTATLALSAEDANNISYTIKLNDEVKGSIAGASGETKNITITGLQPGQEYTFTVIAKDLSENEAAPVNVVATTKALPASAPAPTVEAENVKSLFSNNYTPAVAVNQYREFWWASPTVHTLTLAADDQALYYDDVQPEASFGWALASLDVTDFQKLHLSIYPEKASTIDIWPVVSPEDSFHEISEVLVPEQWNEVVLDYTDRTFAPFTQLGFRGFSNLGWFLLDNVYFFKEVGDATAIENTEVGAKPIKMIENGQLIIIKNGVRYNVAGQVVR